MLNSNTQIFVSKREVTEVLLFSALGNIARIYSEWTENVLKFIKSLIHVFCEL